MRKRIKYMAVYNTQGIQITIYSLFVFYLEIISGLDIGNKTQYPGLDGTHCVTIMGLPYFGKYFT